MSNIVRIFLFLSLVLSVQVWANLDKKIVKNSRILKQKRKKASIIKDKLEDIAKDIENKKREIKKIDEEIKKSNIYINEQKSIYDESVKELKILQKNSKVLDKSKSSIENEIINTISKELSLEIVSKYNDEESVDSLISKEIVGSLSKIMRDKFDNIKNRYLDVSNKIGNVTRKITKLESYIKKMQKRKELLDKMKKDRVKNIKYLKRQKILYDKKLSRIFSEQREIKNTLRRLNILKGRAKVTRRTPKAPNINNQKVRKIGSSYQASRVARYRGKKTIAPLRSFYVKRKFGNYFDPIYKIKIFNDSVVLASKIPNAKVRNVLNGKVVFAKSTPMLDNVVIVENANGIHTIYAHLSKIAPTIKEGRRIRKGYIIGRIKKELTFEVTQKNRHIDPLQLIRF